MNQINLIGNIVADAKRTEINGKQVLNFSVAVNESYQDKSGEWKQKTTFVDCQKWFSLEKTLVFSKGSRIAIFGSLNSYTAEDNGIKRTKYFVQVNDFLMVK